MNMSVKKVAFALAGLAMVGAAHAATVPTVVADATTPSQVYTIGNVATGFTTALTSVYELFVPTASTASSNVTFTLDDTAADGSTVNYALYTDTNSSLGTVAAGSLISSFSLTDTNGTPPSYLLSLLAGAQYVLKITLGAGTIAAITSIVDPVSPVPLPGAALLFGTALLGVGALRRLRGQKAAGVAAA